MWRLSGLWDSAPHRCGRGHEHGALLVCVRCGYGTDDYPRAVFLSTAALLLILMGAFRLSPTACYTSSPAPRGTGGVAHRRRRANRRARARGSSARSGDRATSRSASRRRPGKRRRAHRTACRCSAARRDLPARARREKPHEVIDRDAAALGRDLVRGIVTMLRAVRRADLTTSSSATAAAARARAIRSLSIEDLLGRAPVGLDADRHRASCRGKTRAGHRRRRIDRIGAVPADRRATPGSLVLYERYENGLYTIEQQLHDGNHGAVRCIRLIGDVTDRGAPATRLPRASARDRLPRGRAQARAADGERNPCEAVKNNVIGTRLVAEAAERHGVERFVLISTDKAVNPTSVMGATKRVAELLHVDSWRCGARDHASSAVRFGNVLGSSGSVMPEVPGADRGGGPVTVTHPDITRYFMTDPRGRAARAAGRGARRGRRDLRARHGRADPLVDLARNLIRLSGHTPDEEIAIVFTGLRPGEKLFEELVGDDEIVDVAGRQDPAGHLTSASSRRDRGRPSRAGKAAAQGDRDAVIGLLGRLVPTYQRARVLVTA